MSESVSESEQACQRSAGRSFGDRRFIFGNQLGIDHGKKPIDFGQGHTKVKVTSVKVKMTF